MDIDTSSHVMTTDDREWVIDNTTYKHTVVHIGSPFTYGTPLSVCKALRPQWLTMPALGQKYRKRMVTLAQEATRKCRKQQIRDVHSPSMVSATNKTVIHWYQKHLAIKYQMRFVGRLGNDVVTKFTEELSPLCNEALVRNLDIIAGSPNINLVVAAAEKDATHIQDTAVALSAETQMQEYVAVILKRHQMILEYLLANRRTQLSFTRCPTHPLVFLAATVPMSANAINEDSVSLRTMARPQSTPCKDIVVTLANSYGLFSGEGKTYIGLNPILRNRSFRTLWNYELKCWIVAADGLTDKLVRYTWPSCSNTCGDQGSGTAQPNPGGTSCEFDTNSGIHHEAGISGDTFSDEPMLDLRKDVEAECLRILGLESPVLQASMDAAMDEHPGSAQLNQLWADMVIRGTFIAFIGDWVHATKLCIRIPSKGILLISEPIANPLVPQFDNPEAYQINLPDQRRFTVDGVIRKLNEDDHPWATSTETHLLDVMAGATLIALRLACKGNHLEFPDDVFQEILPEEIEGEVSLVDKSWEDTVAQHCTDKQDIIKGYKGSRKTAQLSMIKKERDSSGDPDPSMDIDPGNFGNDGGDRGARGSGDGQGGSSLRTLGSRKAECSGISFISLNHDLHLRIFDGDLYDSPGYDVFHPFPAHSSVTSIEPQVYSERPSSPQSPGSISPTPSLLSLAGAVSSPGTSVRSKDGMALEPRKGSPVELVLFTCLQQSDNAAAWEAGVEFPGSAEMVPVVAKLAFSDTGLERLIRENKVYNHLSHNRLDQLSVPTCYGVYYSHFEGSYVGLLLTSLVPGTTANKLNDKELMATIPSIRDAVKALHAQGVTHGDIAGRNIIVHESKATLIDFGNACITTQSGRQLEDLNAVDLLLP